MKNRLDEALALRAEKRLQESQQLLLVLQQKFPDDAYINYQAAWSCDLLGEERQAVPYYKKALELGLRAEDEPNAYIGLGSTYRTLGEYQSAHCVLMEGLAKYPENQPLKIFLAMTLYNLANHDEAMKNLLEVIVDTTKDDGVKRYSRAIEFYKDQLNEIW